MKRLNEIKIMVSVKSFISNIPYPEFTGLFFLIALSYTAFYLNNYGTIEPPHKAKPYCNLFEGKWVYDEKSHPLYKGEECPFLLEEFACEKHGRWNLTYQNWRWQPRNCDLPRFNGKAFMEKIRGKTVYFVGDSLIRNQWNSVLCLIEPSLNRSRIEITQGARAFYFKAKEYNAIIAFYWSPFLVESNNDDGPKEHRVVRINAIEKHAMEWNNADILVFNSYAWWLGKNNSLLWGTFDSPDAIYRPAPSRHRSYEMALNTWSDWLEFNINTTKTKMFFMGLSPTHNRGDNLARTGKKYCYNETQPILKEGYVGIDTDIGMRRVLESALQQLAIMGVKVHYLNITQMSDYRKDAHASVHKMYFFNVTKEMFAKNSSILADCLHWCLPGLPDTWNDILYNYIMNS